MMAWSQSQISTSENQGPRVLVCTLLQVSPGSGVPGLVLGRELFWYKQGLVYLEIISRDCHMCLSTCSRDKSQGGGSVRKYLD